VSNTSAVSIGDFLCGRRGKIVMGGWELCLPTEVEVFVGAKLASDVWQIQGHKGH
jgi:hypothetical protein